LRLVEPVLLLPGDRFIVRQFSPVVTIGGGTVLDAHPLREKLSRDERLLRFKAFASGTAGDHLSVRVERQGAAGLTMARAIAETGMPRAAIETLLPQYTRSIARFGEVLVNTAVFIGLQSRIVDWLTSFHASNPLAQGMGKEEVRERTNAAPEVFSALLAKLIADKKIESSGELVRLAGRGVAMKDDETASQRQIEEAFASAGLKVPALKDVLGGLKVDRTRAQKIVTLLLRDKVLVKLSDDLVFHRDALDSLRKTVTKQKTASPRIDVAKFKDLTGVSRKYAIPLLEWLDRERVTRRVGDQREIL
jgi:selenocysteine-specific elongation factor